jgi:hypothetical protein
MKSPKMEMDMATVERRKYEVSEEPEEIDELYTDRDTIMGNSTPEFEKHEGEEPGKRTRAGVGGAPFRTPALVPVDALAHLGLHRDSAHGDNVKDGTREHRTSLIMCLRLQHRDLGRMFSLLHRTSSSVE